MLQTLRTRPVLSDIRSVLANISHDRVPVSLLHVKHRWRWPKPYREGCLRIRNRRRSWNFYALMPFSFRSVDQTKGFILPVGDFLGGEAPCSPWGAHVLSSTGTFQPRRALASAAGSSFIKICSKSQQYPLPHAQHS